MSFTLDNFRTFLRDYDFDNNGTRGVRIYDKIANDAMRELYASGEFDFAQRTLVYDMQPLYNTGTVSVSYGGTTVTGVGTTFTTGTTPSGMVGRYIRFNNEAMQYLITAYSSATSITISNGTDTRGYIGTSTGLSGVTYQITDERRAMTPPSGEPFRAVKRVMVDSGVAAAGPMYNLFPVERQQLEVERKRSRVAMIPRMYSTEFVLTSATQPLTVPTGYIWIHPPPDVTRIITCEIDVWPVALSASTDVCAVPYEAEALLREFGLGFLYREQGRREEAQAQINKAKYEAKNALGNTRSAPSSTCKQEWVPGYGENNLMRPYWPTINPNTPMITP